MNHIQSAPIKRRNLSPKKYAALCARIEEKYEPVLLPYRHIISAMNSAQIAANRDTKLMQQMNGMKTAFEILRYAPSWNVGVRRLQEQIAEPTAPKYFTQAVCIVFADVIAPTLAPLTGLEFEGEPEEEDNGDL